MKIKCKVFLNKANGQKLITIPKKCDIKPGEVVCVETIEEDNE